MPCFHPDLNKKSEPKKCVVCGEKYLKGSKCPESKETAPCKTEK